VVGRVMLADAAEGAAALSVEKTMSVNCTACMTMVGRHPFCVIDGDRLLCKNMKTMFF
jgi:hypothetical protein